MAGINRPLGPLQLIASGQNSITTCTFWALSTDYEQQQQQQEEQEREGPQVRVEGSSRAPPRAAQTPFFLVGTRHRFVLLAFLA